MVPGFINRVPSGHFTGVSAPCTNLQTARNSAIADAVKQILGAINAKYNHLYENKMSGGPRNPNRFIHDDFSRVASGVVLGIERNIVQSSHWQDDSGRYTCFLLVRYPNSKILEMRRLTKGSNIVGSILSESRGMLQINITETNGVAVTLSSAEGTVYKENKFAKMINFCIWKVPYGSEHSFSMALNPIKICGNSSIVKLGLHQAQKSLKDYFLGAKLYFKIKLHGFDELGRSVSTSIEF